MKLGGTGKFPLGKLNPSDQGELAMSVAHDETGKVIINFGKKVLWIGMPPEQAIELAKILLRHAGAKKVEIEL